MMEEPSDHSVQLTTLYAQILKLLLDNPKIAQEKLARRLNVTMRTVQRHVEGLEREGFITIERRRRPHTYSLNRSAITRGLADARYLLDHV